LCTASFGFISFGIWQKRSHRGENNKTPYSLFMSFPPAAVEADYELIMRPYEVNTLVTGVFMCFDVLLQNYTQ